MGISTITCKIFIDGKLFRRKAVEKNAPEIFMTNTCLPQILQFTRWLNKWTAIYSFPNLHVLELISITSIILKIQTRNKRYLTLDCHFFFFSFLGWGEIESTWCVGLLYQLRLSMMNVELSNENWQEKPNNSEKTCPSATLSTRNPTWPDLDSNPGPHGGKQATNRLTYGTDLPIALKSDYFTAIM
jgi:hypothetical protein